MQHFKHYFKMKLEDPSFRESFELECHVCRNTIGIFQRMAEKKISIEEMAMILKVGPKSLCELRDADYCDPDLVVRLCHKLDLSPPEACPRKNRRR